MVPFFGLYPLVDYRLQPRARADGHGFWTSARAGENSGPGPLSEFIN